MRVFVYECLTAGDFPGLIPASLLREGEAMLRAIVEDFARIPGVQVAIANDVRKTADANFTLVIAPELHQLLQIRCSRVKGRLLGSTFAAIKRTSDKLALARFLAMRKVPTPPTLALRFASRLTGRVVVKPRFGAGSLDTRVTTAMHAKSCRSKHSLIVQPFVPGMAASVAWLCGPKQQMPLLPATQRLSRLRYLGGRMPLPSPLAKRAVDLSGRAIQAVPGLAGYIGVDLVLGDSADGSEDYVIEINSRLTTSYLGLRQLAKDNLAEAMLRIAQGLHVPPIGWRKATIQFTCNGKWKLVKPVTRRA